MLRKISVCLNVPWGLSGSIIQEIQCVDLNVLKGSLTHQQESVWLNVLFMLTLTVTMTQTLVTECVYLFVQMVTMLIPTQGNATQDVHLHFMQKTQHTAVWITAQIHSPMIAIRDAWTNAIRYLSQVLTTQQTNAFSNAHHLLITTIKIMFVCIIVSRQDILPTHQPDNVSVDVQM